MVYYHMAGVDSYLFSKIDEDKSMKRFFEKIKIIEHRARAIKGAAQPIISVLNIDCELFIPHPAKRLKGALPPVLSACQITECA